jgi:hypothetical protein
VAGRQIHQRTIVALRDRLSTAGVGRRCSQPDRASRRARGRQDPFSPVFRLFTFNNTRCGSVAELRSNRFVCDSALEGTGFEPSVPLPRLSSIQAVRAEIIGRSTVVFRRDREFDVSALHGRLSTSSQSQCSTDPGGSWHRPLFLTRDRWFESGSLQRRVSHELLCGGLRWSRFLVPSAVKVHPLSVRAIPAARLDLTA